MTLTWALVRASLLWGEQSPTSESSSRVGGRCPLMGDASAATALPNWTTSMLTPELVAIMNDVYAANLEDRLGCDHARQSREPTPSRAGSLA